MRGDSFRVSTDRAPNKDPARLPTGYGLELPLRA
jgi:hypothetical protein